MAKITKTYYSRRNGAYRRFYRRYTRRVNRKMYNRVNLNYMRAKINFMFSLSPDDSAEYLYKFREVGGGNRYANKIDVLDKINDVSEYRLYNSLFNEVKLLGVAVKFSPMNTALNRNSNPVTVYCTYKEGNYNTDPMALTPVAVSRKYFKNWNRKWVPSNQEQAVINQGRDLDFWIDCGSKSTANLANSPGWFVEVIAYVQFRKNLTL